METLAGRSQTTRTIGAIALAWIGLRPTRTIVKNLKRSPGRPKSIPATIIFPRIYCASSHHGGRQLFMKEMQRRNVFINSAMTEIKNMYDSTTGRKLGEKKKQQQRNSYRVRAS